MSPSARLIAQIREQIHAEAKARRMAALAAIEADRPKPERPSPTEAVVR